MTIELLEKLKNVDIRTVNIDDLADLRTVNIKKDLPEEECAEDFFDQIKNPYCYRVGDVAIKEKYSDCVATLEDRLISFIMKSF